MLALGLGPLPCIAQRHEAIKPKAKFEIEFTSSLQSVSSVESESQPNVSVSLRPTPRLRAYFWPSAATLPLVQSASRQRHCSKSQDGPNPTRPPSRGARGIFIGDGVLATERDSMSTHSRSYKHKRERLPSSNTRGGRPKSAAGRPREAKQGYGLCKCMRQAQGRPGATSHTPHTPQG